MKMNECVMVELEPLPLVLLVVVRTMHHAEWLHDEYTCVQHVAGCNIQIPS